MDHEGKEKSPWISQKKCILLIKQIKNLSTLPVSAASHNLAMKQVVPELNLSVNHYYDMKNPSSESLASLPENWNNSLSLSLSLSGLSISERIIEVLSD